MFVYHSYVLKTIVKFCSGYCRLLSWLVGLSPCLLLAIVALLICIPFGRPNFTAALNCPNVLAVEHGLHSGNITY
jgi:hypothetical protein